MQIYAATLIACGAYLSAFGADHTVPQQIGWGGVTYNLGSSGLIRSDSWSGFGEPASGPVVTNVAMDSSCQYLFHAKTDENTVIEYTTVLASNFISPYAPVPAGTAPVAVAADTTFKFLYVANSGSNDVSAYTVDAPSGTLTPVAGSPFPAGGQPNSVLVVQSWVYVTNAVDNTVSAYSRDATTGVLIPVAGSPFPVGTAPSGLVAATTDLSHSPSGSLLYVANQGSNSISAFVIRSDGSLQPVVGSPFATGAAPKGMTVAVGPQ